MLHPYGLTMIGLAPSTLTSATESTALLTQATCKSRATMRMMMIKTKMIVSKSNT
jgi:hypothetical protein